jgi:hypothetical protein
MKPIKKDDRGPQVKAWQEFLRGAGLYFGEFHGHFDEETEHATKEFQIGLNADLFRVDRGGAPMIVDGIAGNQTLGAAMMLGFEIVPAQSDANWPPKPKGHRWLSYHKREAIFGKVLVRPAPITGMPEAVKIVNDWQKDNLRRIGIPQIKELAKRYPNGAWPRNGQIFCHALMVDPWRELFQACEDEDVLFDLETNGGFWVARFVRGSRSLLSNHTWGTAGDFNVYWNLQRRRPALLGERGCIRRVANIALRLGWHWGGFGWGAGTAKDGMHLEPGEKLIKRIT